MGDIIKIVKSHEESSLLQNMLAGKEVIRATVGAIAGVGDSSRRHAWSETLATQTNIQGRRTTRAGQDF